MKIGILLADELRDTLRDNFCHYADMFCGLLDGNGFTFHVYAVHENIFPADIGECDGYLITGSRHGAYDDLPWLPPLFDLIRRLHAAKTPLIGICFGHQAIAHALGGRVEKSDKGWGLGAHEWNISEAAPWMTAAGDTLRLLCVHQDQVVQLPPGAILLAGSPFCPNAAYAIGYHIFCVQGHPEFSAAYVHALLDHLKDRVPAPQLATAAETLSQKVDQNRTAEWMVNFFKQSQR